MFQKKKTKKQYIQLRRTFWCWFHFALACISNNFLLIINYMFICHLRSFNVNIQYHIQNVPTRNCVWKSKNITVMLVAITQIVGVMWFSSWDNTHITIWYCIFHTLRNLLVVWFSLRTYQSKYFLFISQELKTKTIKAHLNETILNLTLCCNSFPKTQKKNAYDTQNIMHKY